MCWPLRHKKFVGRFLALSYGVTAMPAQCPTIRERFALYRQFIEEQKMVQESPLRLKGGGTNAGWVTAASPLLHPTISEKTEFVAKQSRRNFPKYELKIMAPFLCERPCFRFESDGPPHRNNFPEIPLPEQQVTTPHFHHFTRDGYELAYKTDALRNSGNCQAIIRDMSFGVSHFCQEGQIGRLDGGVPEVQAEGIPLSLPTNIDPLEGVPFH